MAMTLAIVNDRELVRAGLACLLQRGGGCSILYSGPSLRAAAAMPEAAEVVLLDLGSHWGQHELDAIARLSGRGSHVIIVGTQPHPRRLRSLLDAGAAGYLSTYESAGTLIRVVHAALRGDVWTEPSMLAAVQQRVERPDLSEREWTTLRLYVSGMKLSTVAREMAVQVTSAKTYLDRVRHKYAAVGRPARTRLELYLAALEDGVLDGEDPTARRPC